MEKNIIKKFTRFLKEHNAYKEFINEFKNPKGIYVRRGWAESEVHWKSDKFNSVPNETFEGYCNSLERPEELINFAFSWGDTNKRYDYWESLSTAWRKNIESYKELRKINIKNLVI